MTPRRRLQQTGKFLMLVPIAVLFLLPLIWMLSTSLKPDSQLFQWPPVWLPNPVLWSNYAEALRFFPFLTYLKNTLIMSVLAVTGIVLSCSLGAYGMTKIDWRGGRILFFIVIATMMLPFQVVMIPQYLIFRNLGWIDSLLPLIVPFWFGHPFFIFLLRQFFLTIPRELSLSAKIDGASEFTTYLRIVLPLAKPALFTVALFMFLQRWNDFVGPLIYINTMSKFTLSLGLQQFVSQFGAEWALLMAASAVVTLPIIILFFFTQRTFIEGISMTGMKG